MRLTITRRIQFCAGHRVKGHEGKCRNLHGHNYVAIFHATANALDSVGRVIDFSALKDTLGGWIEKWWDHGFIVGTDDAEAAAACMLVPEQKLYGLPYNPTAENMATYLLQVANSCGLSPAIRVVGVELYETENCKAEAWAEDWPPAYKDPWA